MRQAVRRVAAMPSEELIFRLRSELRKTTNRISAGLFQPRWDRSHLLGALTRDVAGTDWNASVTALERRDFTGAHQALARHFSRRSSPFPLNAARVPAVSAIVTATFPAAPADAARRAAAICDGRYDLLGYQGIDVGGRPDWHRDPTSGRVSPMLFWSSVPYLDPAAGDHKVIWELNRHQHWLALGRAYALTGDARFYGAFTQQLASWLGANPPLIGTNWASMLELAMRAMSWLWALELFVPGAGDHDQDPWLVDLLLALDRQVAHVEHNLSRYFSPNTHLSGEALALYVAGLALPELQASARRVELGREILLQEAARQVRADGGHVELSAHYQRYSTDYYLLAAAVAERAGDPAAGVFEESARKQATFLRAIVSNEGIRPQIGDDDGGQLFPICGRDPEDCRDTLATAAVLLGDSRLAIGAAPEETYWRCGLRSAPPLSDGAPASASAALEASGYFVSRTEDGDCLVFDAGPHGFLNGGHAHADALACVVTLKGRPLLIDSGTATYTMDPAARDRFRSTMMHNTIVVDGMSQSIPRGPFHWYSTTDATASILEISTGCEYFEASHDGYRPRRHTRGILAVHGIGWFILDHVLGPGEASIECYWHLHPHWAVGPEPSHVAPLQCGDFSTALASTAALTRIAPGASECAFHSPAYGRILPAPLLVGRTTAALPVTIASFLPATPAVARGLRLGTLAVEEDPGPGWRGSAFRAQWENGAATVLAALEAGGTPGPDRRAPAVRWGTNRVRIDGRVAALIESASGVGEAILVHGAALESSLPQAALTLPHPVALTRRPAAAGINPFTHGIRAVG